MPYIITIARPLSVTRTAVATLEDTVATLEEAREAARAAIDHARLAHYDAQVTNLPESGGTIGPLPDGTVIGVEQVAWSWFEGLRPDHGNLSEAIGVYNASAAARPPHQEA